MEIPGKSTFAAEYEPAEGCARRNAPRAPVSIEAGIVRGGLDRVLCKVTDLSVRGARLQTYSSLRRDAVILLSLPRIGPVPARVVWASDFDAGLEFQSPLSAETFKTLTAR